MRQALANSSLDVSLAEARERFIADNPRSRAAHLEATAVMPGGNTRSVLFHTPFPLTVIRGEGSRLWDADGHEYVDLLGEYTAGTYGHNNSVIRSAIDRALDGGWTQRERVDGGAVRAPHLRALSRNRSRPLHE